MAGRGMAPKAPTSRRNGHAPIRGEWSPTEKQGWQHGEIPKPPAKLTTAARDAWSVWFKAWFAAHWTPDDLPGLRQVIWLYNACAKGDQTRAGELRQMMDNYGITPKGQQDRRWAKPEEAPVEPPASGQASTPEAAGPYGHLRVVGGA